MSNINMIACIIYSNLNDIQPNFLIFKHSNLEFEKKKIKE